MSSISLEEVIFTDCRFDISTFLAAVFKKAAFDNCYVNDALFCQPEVERTLRFKDCEMKEIDLREMKVADKLYLRGSSLESIWGISYLKNIVISTDQLMQIAPTLALEANLKILDES